MVEKCNVAEQFIKLNKSRIDVMIPKRIQDITHSNKQITIDIIKQLQIIHYEQRNIDHVGSNRRLLLYIVITILSINK